jgi:hypothetical protein
VLVWLRVEENRKGTYRHGIYTCIYSSAILKRAKQRAMHRADVDHCALNPPCA